MHAYHCWHYLCRETGRIVFAVNAYYARKELAVDLGVHVTDIVARRA